MVLSGIHSLSLLDAGDHHIHLFRVSVRGSYFVWYYVALNILLDELGGVLVDRALYIVYVDESGSDHPVRRKNIRRKDVLFVVFAAIVLNNKVSHLVKHYIQVMSRLLNACSGAITMSKLFEVYRVCTGRDPGIKAGYLLGLEGPFKIFSMAREECRGAVSRQLLGIAMEMLSVLMELCEHAIAVIVDKIRLDEFSKKSGRNFDARLIAMDFLFTRIARFLETRSARAIVVHDETQRAEEIEGLLTELKTKGYFYNPKLGYRPRYELIERIHFVDSTKCLHIQYVDLAANAILRAKASASRELYKAIASYTKYREVVVPKN